MNSAEKFDNHVDAVAGSLESIARDLKVIGAEEAEIGTLSLQILNQIMAIHKAEQEVLDLLKQARALELAEWEKSVL